ncbi:APC family permease [Microaerobacter geothermalis]|uniref:APC family permease n=1 Tax=Microaerobacter geothermalis TaxID=674972 RepID=UPI001F432DB4|nr:APC family permease [Microaerobacter geothermalis]MCF6094946.1 APC family permease [Microaerobacter geothermalis]
MKKNDEGFVRVLTRWDILVLSFGAMIGWGWVVLSGSWVQSAGTLGAIIAFLLGGILVTFVGLTYSELTAAMPKVGGEHVFTHRAMGAKWAFIASWAIALGYISVVAFEAVALPTVVEYLFPNYKVGYLWTIAGWDVYASWAAIGIIGSIMLTLLNYIGVKPAAVFQLICTTLLALVGLSLIGGSTFAQGAPNPLPSFIDGWGGIMTVLVMTPFMFVGFDVIPQAAEEINLPNKQIGNVLILSVVLAVLWYIGIIYGVGSALTGEQMANSSLATADAMSAIFSSPFAAKILIIAGIGGILTSWNAFFIGGSRILYAMAQSKMLPAWLGKLHPKYKTPSNAILLIGILSVLAPLFGRKMLVWLVDAGGVNIVLTYLLVAISFLILRKRESEMERPFLAGKSPWVGWVATILSAGLILLYLPGMPSALVWPYEWVIVLVWWIVGAYFMMQMPADTHVSYSTDLEEIAE